MSGFVGNGIGNSTPLLNHPSIPTSGTSIAANFLCANITFGSKVEFLKGFKVYHPMRNWCPSGKCRPFSTTASTWPEKKFPISIPRREGRYQDFIRHIRTPGEQPGQLSTCDR